MLLDNFTYKEALQKIPQLKELGVKTIYLKDEVENYPFDKVTYQETGGTHRMDIATDYRFQYESEELGVTFSWNIDIEPYSANGSSSYQIDKDTVKRVLKRLVGYSKTQFRQYIANCIKAVEKRGREYQEYADKHFADSAILRDIMKTK